MKNAPNKFRWYLWALVMIVGMIVLMLFNVTRSATRRFDAATSRLSKTNVPLTLDDLYQRQQRSKVWSKIEDQEIALKTTIETVSAQD